jgi:hypothetical protein
VDPGDYRRISLKYSFCKLLAGIVSRRVTKFLMESDQVQDSLHGFLPGRSTITASNDLFGWIRSTMQKKGKVYVVSVNFSNCFDTVDRGIALNACAQTDIRRVVLDLLSRMLGPRETLGCLTGRSSVTPSVRRPGWLNAITSLQ